MFAESLAGRKAIFELYPLDFYEFLLFKGVTKYWSGSLMVKISGKNKVAYEHERKLYEEFLAFGGFPQVVLAETVALKRDRLGDIFKSYFEKDVQSLAEFKDVRPFRDLLLLLFARIGSKLDISKLASEVGVSRPTIYSYLAFLQATYVIHLVSPFSKSIDREVSGAKKVYVCDTGLANQLSKISEGAILENAIHNQLRRYGKVCYYERRIGGEIDFVLPESKIGLEVKLTGTPQDYAHLTRTARQLKLRQGYVVTKRFIPGKGFLLANDL